MGKSIVGKITTKTTKHLTPIDSGVVVSPNDIIPFQDRKYDLVIMGATGFTGSLCVRHLAKTYGVNTTNGAGVKWAMAGRSQSKLNEVKKRWAQELGNDDILTVDTILVDTKCVFFVLRRHVSVLFVLSGRIMSLEMMCVRDCIFQN